MEAIYNNKQVKFCCCFLLAIIVDAYRKHDSFSISYDTKGDSHTIRFVINIHPQLKAQIWHELVPVGLVAFILTNTIS